MDTSGSSNTVKGRRMSNFLGFGGRKEKNKATEVVSSIHPSQCQKAAVCSAEWELQRMAALQRSHSLDAGMLSTMQGAVALQLAP